MFTPCPVAVFALVLAAPAPDSAEAAATRAVIAAVRESAASNKPAATRQDGDALTNRYVRAAAVAALRQPEPVRVRAFLVGIGVALDDSTTLRDNLLTRTAVRAAETDAERKARLAVLGGPTMRRRDLCQHFVVSAALSELVGPEAAASVGLAKEMLDMTRPGGSGFSFADLAADYAGLTFAAKVRADPKTLEAIAAGFEVADAMPKIDGLPEGLTAAKFKEEYGSADDPRFQAMLAEVRKRAEKP